MPELKEYPKLIRDLNKEIIFMKSEIAGLQQESKDLSLPYRIKVFIPVENGKRSNEDERDTKLELLLKGDTKYQEVQIAINELTYKMEMAKIDMYFYINSIKAAQIEMVGTSQEDAVAAFAVL